MKLLQACLCVGKTCFNGREGAVKPVKARLSFRKDQKAVLTTEKSL